jgi:hypothetical protein
MNDGIFLDTNVMFTHEKSRDIECLANTQSALVPLGKGKLSLG